MATWIAHLRIAENLLARIPGLNPGQFAIGNIAPDAGIPDENWKNFNPPPTVTHFKRSQSVHKDIADLDFYREYLAHVSPDDIDCYSFRLGYFFHLITDNLWTIDIGKPTTERYGEQFAADKDFIWEVKRDWYGLDQIYVREHSESLYWRVFLDAEPASGQPDFFPPEALPRQLRHIKEFYQRDDDEIQAMMDRPMIYLSKDKMDQFVEDTTESIDQIYQILWPEPPDLDGKFSALELFP